MFCTGAGAVRMAGHSVRCYPYPKAGAPLGATFTRVEDIYGNTRLTDCSGAPRVGWNLY